MLIGGIPVIIELPMFHDRQRSLLFSLMDGGQKPTSTKRNYIRRKKYLHEAFTTIRNTLEFITLALNERVDQNQLNRIATRHAQAIEAACWSPHSKLTADSYQALMNMKTRELCRALTKQSLPSIDLQKLRALTQRIESQTSSQQGQNPKQTVLHTSPPEGESTRSKTPQPLPVPIFPSSAPSFQLPNSIDQDDSLPQFSADLSLLGDLESQEVLSDFPETFSNSSELFRTNFREFPHIGMGVEDFHF